MQQISALNLIDFDSGSKAKLPLNTYFNSFPAAFWVANTTVSSVYLQFWSTGLGSFQVFASDHQANKSLVESREISEGFNEVSLPLAGENNLGWYWVEFSAQAQNQISEVSWMVKESPKRSGKASIAITTFNKPDYVIKNLSILSNAEELLTHIDRIFVVDQGIDKVTSQAQFPAIAKKLKSKLQVIDQANLGGSGGFSRGMFEASKSPESAFVMLMDDDVSIEPESIRRAIIFAQYTTNPTIVGGHMFDLNEPTVIHGWSEVVERKPFAWHPSDDEQLRHDFAKQNLLATPWAHRPYVSDYNGWWMCLIPTEVVKEIGLSIPVFIKWDDAEYGLRAQTAGYPTITLPGVALWHIAWVDKDDTLDWQSYFHTRNRIIAALLHSPYKGGGSLLSYLFMHTVKQLLNMQYFSVETSLKALRDIRRGEKYISETLPEKLTEVRELMKQFPETVLHKVDRKEFEDLFESGETPLSEKPRRLGLIMWMVPKMFSHALVGDSKDSHPQKYLLKKQTAWHLTPTYRSVAIADSENTGWYWYRRDRKKFLSLFFSSMWNLSRLYFGWGRLAKKYRAGAKEFSSPENWQKIWGN
ncbi:MAG: glycosyltransferase [Microbacteriaceae bacterium]|nr:glycosyltransferase [Microbacteriaceae bacterium]